MIEPDTDAVDIVGVYPLYTWSAGYHILSRFPVRVKLNSFKGLSNNINVPFLLPGLGPGDLPWLLRYLLIISCLRNATLCAY